MEKAFLQRLDRSREGIQNNMRRLDEEVAHQHYCEANHKRGRLLSFDKLHTSLPSVHATDFRLDLQPGVWGGGVLPHQPARVQ